MASEMLVTITLTGILFSIIYFNLVLFILV